MMTKKDFTFGGLLLGLVLILGGLIGYQEYVLATGERVILKTVPVDPRDIFRGDYVILGYDIAQQAQAFVDEESKELDPGQPVYVRLDDNIPATATGLSVKPYSEGLYLKGELGWSYDIRFPSLAQFYVPEGQGLAVERLQREGELYVEVAVSGGQPRITRLLDEDLNEVVVTDLD